MQWKKRIEPWVGLAVALIVVAALAASAADVATWQSITYDASNRAYPVYWEANANVYSARFLIPAASTTAYFTVPLNAQDADQIVFEVMPDTPFAAQKEVTTATAPLVTLLASPYIDTESNLFQPVFSSGTITGVTYSTFTQHFYQPVMADLGGYPWVCFQLTANNATAELFVTLKKRK